MTLPDKLTAAEFERLKAQEQRMLNSGSWVPQSEDRLTAQVNAAAADSAAPESMTAEQADVAEAQQSVMAETQFGRSVGIRPDYSQPPAKDPAEDEPKTIGELRKRQQDLYNDPSYDMPFEEWQDFTRWKKQNESEVGSFISGIPGMAESLGQLGVGLVKERAQQLYRATAGLDPIGAAATEIATFKEMGRKIGVGLTQLSDWVGGKVSDIVESGRRVGQVQQNVIQALRDNGQLTGDPIQDNTTIQKALEEAAAQGMYEPTQQQAEEDEEVGYQRYQRKKAYDREYAGITEFSIGGNRMTLPDVKETVTMPTLLPNTEQSKGVNVERQVFQPQEATSTVGAMAFSPENALPIGVGVLARARMLRRLASVTGTPLRATETAMASVDDWLARTADRVTSKVPFVGDLPLNQRAYALGAAGGVGAYLDATTDSPVIDVIAKPLIVAGLVLPAAKAAGGTIRRVGTGAGAGWQVIKEMDAGAVGSARAETAARMAASGKFNPRYSKYMERGAQGGVESTLRRVSQNPDMPETLRRVARSADNIGITQLARGIDDAVSSSVAAGVAATPFALVAPDSETAGGIVGGALLLGGTLGTAGRVIGRRSARTDADIARMMVDVEMAGGDAGSLGALSYSGLDLLAAMQGITSGKVDFVPLRAQEYRANADVRASGGETVAGLHIEKAADGRAKVYVNMGHTAPIAGRVSIKPIQITRNGKTEDANVVRIKGEDGQSDFTVVPREYPLLVKSGDFVEPNARLARGLSPTHVMPHEIGHAILTSSILNGSIRDDLRNLVNQRYDTAGVEARGREYVTRIVDKDILAGAHDQLPDKLTQQEFDEISSGRRTMADVLKGKPVSDAQREQMITDRYNEMRERSIAEGNNPDGLDVFRDEIVAETFSSLSDSLDFRRMRAGGPQVMESVLAATARVFETMGVKFDRSTGKLMDNPSVVFRDNPLMQDPIMRKRMQEHLRNYEAWMLGMEQAGAREQKGTQISVDGSAESARRSTHTKLRANDNGVLENDLIYIDQNGQAQWKPQKMLDEQEKGRSAQVGQLYDKNKILPPNSAEFGLRRAGVGRTVISGPTLPAKFDVLRWFPKHIREMARMLEAGREGGASHIFDYNTIGTGEGGRYRVINRGDVRAIIREGAFLGWEATKNGHLKAVVMDLNAFRSAAMRAINRGELGIFNNDMSQLQADLMVYLANHKNGLPGEATIGQQKRDMLNGLIGTGTAVQRDINPLYADLNPRGSVRSFRFDRINDITPTGRDGYHFDYDKIKNNRMPQALPREAMGMPDAPANLTTDQILRELEENQGYLGLSTLGMREGRPVKGGAQQTRELLKRNTALNEELRRRGGTQEESDVQRVLRQRGQAMPDSDTPDAPRRYVSMEKFIKEAGEDLDVVLANAYNDMDYNEDRTALVGYSDTRNSMYRSRIPVKEFFDWLHSDRVMDGLVFDKEYKPATAGEGASHTRESYQALIDRLRKISLKPSKQTATGGTRGQAMPDVAVVPERFTGTGQEPNRQSRFVEPPPFFARFPIESYERGGKFFDAQSGEDLTGRSYGAGFIDVSSGKPRLFVDGDPAAQPAKSGRTYRTNLFKQKAGWKWISENAPATSTIVSVEGGGRHVYALRADFEGGVDLARYSDKPSEPRLRPTARGGLSLGNEVGRISIRGKEHPVYDGARITQQNAPRGQAMPDVDFAPARISDSALEVEDSPLRISTRTPSAKAATENPLTDQLSIDTSSIARAGALSKVTGVIGQYPGIKFSSRSPEGRAQELIRFEADNLLWLHDQVAGDIRDRSSLWYDGARNISVQWSGVYGVPRQGNAAAIAALSPQKDWYMNVSLARRVLEMTTQNRQRVFGDAEFQWASAKMKQVAPIQKMLKELRGKPFSEMTSYEKAVFTRAFDEINNPRGYEILSPEGEFLGPATNKDGSPSRVAWGDFNSIAKAVLVTEDPRPEIISKALGEEHKVRSFYNNIILPNYARFGDVTIDTHAVAAALLRPLAGSDIPVLHHFGGSGAGGSAITGHSGTYGLHADAYRLAASERGILPRQMQSITWEAVRGLFAAEWKTAANKALVDKIWMRYKKGEIDINETRKQISDAAGGITPPSWYRPNP